MNDIQISKVQNALSLPGQWKISALVTYPGEAPQAVAFLHFAGSVVMITKGGQDFIDDPARFGPFGLQWVRNFFDGRER